MSATMVARRPVLLVYLAVFGLMTGQQTVNPILPPLAHELGFSEFALGIFAPTAPYLLGTLLLAGLAVFTFVHPGVRQTPAAAPVPMEDHGSR